MQLVRALLILSKLWCKESKLNYIIVMKKEKRITLQSISAGILLDQ